MEFIGVVILSFIAIVLQLLWWVISTFYLVIIVGLIVAVPLYFLSKMEGSWNRMTKPKKQQYRVTPFEPDIYYNQMGNLVMNEPDHEMEKMIREYMRDMGITERNFRR